MYDLFYCCLYYVIFVRYDENKCLSLEILKIIIIIMKSKLLTILFGSLLIVLNSCGTELESTMDSVDQSTSKVGDDLSNRLLYATGLMGEKLDVLPSQSENEGGYYIVSKHSHRALTRVNNGHNIRQTEDVFPNNSYLEPSAQADIAIYNEHVRRNDGHITVTYKIQWGNEKTWRNNFWEVHDALIGAGAPVVTTASKPHDHRQNFIFEPTGDADQSVYIKNVDQGMYLQIRGGSKESGAVLEQGLFRGDNPQKFYILTKNKIIGENIDVLPTNSQEKSGFYLVNKRSQRAVTRVPNGNVVLQTEHVFPNNTFTPPTMQADISIYNQDINSQTKAYKIQWGNEHTRANNFWELHDALIGEGAPVVTTASKANDLRQMFIFEPTGDSDNSFYIKNVVKGMYLQIKQGSRESGARLEQGIFRGDNSQKFYLLTRLLQ
jgi:ribosomal protein S6E (S10)